MTLLHYPHNGPEESTGMRGATAEAAPCPTLLSMSFSRLPLALKPLVSALEPGSWV